MHTPASAGRESPRVIELGVRDYLPVWRAMQTFTAARSAGTRDELWIVQHPPVYTVGLAGRPEHLPRTANGVPVVHVDRGGQITYHGPGQAVVYLLLDLRRLGLSVRELVRRMESAVLDLLAHHGIEGERRAGAPGVYVGGAKIAALGLRVKNGGCYHGVALNVAMDLAPFALIDPCGYRGLAVTQLSELGVHVGVDETGRLLAQRIVAELPAP